MSKQKIYFIFLGIIFITLLLFLTVEVESKNILSDIGKESSKIKSYIAEYEILDYGKRFECKQWLTEKKKRINVKTIFSKGNTTKMIKAFDGQIGWNYYPQEGKVYKRNFTEVEKHKETNFFMEYIYDLRYPFKILGVNVKRIKYLGQEHKNHEKLYKYLIIGFTFKDSVLLYNIIGVDKQGLLRNVKVYNDTFKLIYESKVNKVIVNPTILNKQFHLNLPSNIDIKEGQAKDENYLLNLK